MGNQYREHYFECDVLFLSASPAMNAASLVSSYFVTTFAHALTGNVSILWMRRLESSFVIS